MAGIRKTVMKAVEIPSYHLSTLPTVSTVTVKKCAHRTDAKDASIPVDVIIRGKKRAS
jgi:hypothetical protein